MGQKVAKYYDDTEVPELLDMAAGASYMRQVHARDERYETWQYRFWMQYLEGIALSRFEWHDLPEGIDPARWSSSCTASAWPGCSWTAAGTCSRKRATATV